MRCNFVLSYRLWEQLRSIYNWFSPHIWFPPYLSPSDTPLIDWQGRHGSLLRQPAHQQFEFALWSGLSINYSNAISSFTLCFAGMRYVACYMGESDREVFLKLSTIQKFRYAYDCIPAANAIENIHELCWADYHSKLYLCWLKSGFVSLTNPPPLLLKWDSSDTFFLAAGKNGWSQGRLTVHSPIQTTFKTQVFRIFG